MDFVIRLKGEIDQAMTLFQLRRIGATGEFSLPGKGGTDMQIIGDVPDDKVDALIEGFASMNGAVHVAGRHIRLGAGDCDSIQEAEAHMGGPYSVLGTPRAAWSFGGDVADHLVQVLHSHPEHIPVSQLRAEMDVGIELVVPALKQLTVDGVVRKFRHDDGEAYGLARTARDKIDAVVAAAT